MLSSEEVIDVEEVFPPPFSADLVRTLFVWTKNHVWVERDVHSNQNHIDRRQSAKKTEGMSSRNIVHGIIEWKLYS